MLILDLDDTIYEAASLSPQTLEPALISIKEYYDPQQASAIIAELWYKPIDVVIQKFNIPQPVVAECFRRLQQVSFEEIEITPFEDYSVIKQLPQLKTLVTSGLEPLQLAKVQALGISSDFQSIHVDDPRLQPRQHKLDIFRMILEASQFPAADIWVIGDNPQSELQAAKELGMRTIQRRAPHKSDWEQADHIIDTFYELEEIIK